MHRVGPAASQVAREALEPAPPAPVALAPAAERAPRETAHALTLSACAGGCPHTSAPCAALKGLLGHSKLVSDEARSWSQRLVPCNSCSVDFKVRAASLRGLRLGKREREILVGAAAQEIYAVTAPGMTRPMSAARRRAAQTLARAGLVAPAVKGDGPPAASFQTRAAVRLTPLGLYVLAAFGRFIEGGKAVRWDRPRAGVPMPGQEPNSLAHEVLERTRAELHTTLDELKRVLIAAVARPVRDPGQLETVTRHLQTKAKGLRDLLEPAGLPKDLP